MKLEDHDVSWNSPSENHHGSMPLGNGDIGLNVWMEPSGDLCFYIGKTDSWGDDSRLLKVGKVRIKFTPSPVSSDGEFSQTLKLKTGEIFISSAAGKSKTGIRIWVDANNPVIGVAVDSNIPLKAEAAIELWRTEHCLLPPQVSDIYRNCPDKDKMQFAEPDTLIENLEDGIGWYHHNEKSDGPAMTMEYQGIADAPSFNDPILHRTFGAVIKAGNATRLDERTLETAISEKQNICIYVLTEHPSSPALWLNSMLKTIREIEKQDYDLRWQAHTKWWNDFWNRSHIYISADDEQDAKAVAAVSRAYNLQRFINACGGRGRYPIKFNGSIFTVPPADAPLDADYRRWGGGYWWQNTRLPYIGMCASGDYDLMQSLFRMYFEDILPVCLHRTRKYFGHDGAYFPECMYHWGAVFSETYGWEAPFELREDPLQTSGWHKWEWVAGLELTFMMQDYYDHTKDEKFLKEILIPAAMAVITFFEQHYKTDDAGVMVMHPAMACETWWNCTDPMPELAGLYAVIDRLLGLSPALTTESQRKYWQDLKGILPELPLRDTEEGKAFAPAAKYEDKRNCENPELYAVFPFRRTAVGSPDLTPAINALKYRQDKGVFGWRQDDIFMAYLGLADQVEEAIIERAGNYDKNSRFPAFWGPNYDWVPDQDHGGVLLKTCQAMLMQEDMYSGKIYLLPAWPAHWNASFKLHAARNTVIEGVVSNGRLLDLKVFPEARRKDIIINSSFNSPAE